MRKFSETARLALVAFVCAGAGSAVSAAGPAFFGSGSWFFTETGFTNLNGALPDGQIKLFNTDGLGATFHASGNGHTGFLASRHSDDRFGPVLVFHKGWGKSGAAAPVRTGSYLGALAFKGTGDTAGRQVTGAQFDIVAAAAAPSMKDMETRARIQLVGPASNTLSPMAEWQIGAGMRMYGEVVINEDRHPILREYPRIELANGTVSPRAANQLVAVKDDPQGRKLAISDGHAWRFADGQLVYQSRR